MKKILQFVGGIVIGLLATASINWYNGLEPSNDAKRLIKLMETEEWEGDSLELMNKTKNINLYKICDTLHVKVRPKIYTEWNRLNFGWYDEICLKRAYRKIIDNMEDSKQKQSKRIFNILENELGNKSQ